MSQPRHYESLALASWWDAINAQPGCFLLLGQFADELTDMGHKIAPAMRWIFEAKRVPHLDENVRGQIWYWFSEVSTKTIRRRFRFDFAESCLLPQWLMKGTGTFGWLARYESPSSAYRNLCRRFIAREKKLRLNEGMFVA